MSLIYYYADGIRFFYDRATSKRFITIADYSRLSGQNNNTIRKRCQRMTATTDTIRTAQIKTKNGTRSAFLISVDCVMLWLKKDRPEIAKHLKSVNNSEQY